MRLLKTMLLCSVSALAIASATAPAAAFVKDKPECVGDWSASKMMSGCYVESAANSNDESVSIAYNDVPTVTMNHDEKSKADAGGSPSGMDGDR